MSINVDDLYFFKQNLENILLKITVYACKIHFLWLQSVTYCSLQWHCWYTVFTRVSARGAHSREALFRGRRSLNISKKHQNIFNLYL